MKQMLIIAAFVSVICAVSCSQRKGPDETRRNLQAIAIAIDMYEVDNERLPSDLKEIGPNPKGWGASATGYVKPTVTTTDSWGRALRYSHGTNWYELRSSGPDRRFDTPDDLFIGTKRGPNQASDATSEPAPGAGSSAHQR